MIRRALGARFAGIEKALATMPLRPMVVRKAFEHFRETGELPDEQRLADAVARTALNGGKPPVDAALMSRIELLIVGAGNQPVLTVVPRVPEQTPAAPPVRAALFHQAVFDTGVPQRAARSALCWLVDGGEDVTDPQFAAKHGVPKHSSLGMHILGWPGYLAKPPYEEQAHRLFARMDALRNRTDQTSADWFDPFAEAFENFWATGDLPAPGLIRDMLFVFEELEALHAHRRGKNVRKLMAAFDRMWLSQGEECETAIATLLKLLCGKPPPSGHKADAPSM